MQQVKSIIKIKDTDWEKSLSYDTETFTNGVFKVLSNVNPFVRKGNLQPTVTVTAITGSAGGTAIDTTREIRAIIPIGNSQFYALADYSKLYLIDFTTPTAPTADDKSGGITAVNGVAQGMTLWKNGIVYIVNGIAEYNANPVASGSKVVLLTGATALDNNGIIVPMCVGADGLLYIGNKHNVARCTVATGTAGNDKTVAAALETGFYVRALINDGRYLVWIADDAGLQGGRCLVAFWDLAKSIFDQLYEFDGIKIGSAELIGDVIKIVTPNGIYITNFTNKPKLLVPFGTTVNPASSSTLSTSSYSSNAYGSINFGGNILMWNTGTKVYGFGNKYIDKPDRLFQPYTITGATTTDALGTDGNYILWSGVISAQVKLYNLTASATNNTSVANVASIVLPQPYSYDHTKVVLRSPITSGDSVSLKILTSGGTKTIKASETKTNTTDPGEKNLIFNHTSAGDGTDVKAFDEISDIELTTNVPIRDMEVFGTPTDDRSSYG